MASSEPVLEIDQQAFEKASAQGRRLLARGPLAVSAKARAGRVQVELNNGCAFVFPAAQAQGLAGASAAALADVQVTSAGLGLHWPKLDADLYVPSLIKGVLGTKRWMAQIGAAGGRASSQSKGEAARANGKLGGRPRKLPSPSR